MTLLPCAPSFPWLPLPCAPCFPWLPLPCAPCFPWLSLPCAPCFPSLPLPWSALFVFRGSVLPALANCGSLRVNHHQPATPPMGAPDDTSSSAGPTNFTQTHWSVVLQAGDGKSTEA